ncbi:MAG TPA: FAD-dependent monooxygenase [Segeticoccus sp.]|nr:FAD-dependent monooxygenase [Segeticoccus sp.]
MKAVVIGGGIGGLASAVALSRAGHEVEVLEQAPEFSEVGAGLSLWPNAVRALDALGVGNAVRARSATPRQGGIRDSAGRWLARQDVAAITRRFGPLLMVHRADLLDVLHDAVPPAALRAGTRVEDVTEDGLVRHSAGESRGDVVIGADGTNSTVRQRLWRSAAPPRYAGYVAYRMLTTPVDLADEGGETWGRGERFGYVPLPDGRYYCFAAVTAPAGSASEGLAELRRRFAGWHPPIPELLEAVPDEDAVLFHDLADLPPLESYVRGRVALLGDAAHAMTPNLGQGAGQAIEDAVVLAQALGTAGSPTTAGGLTAYDRLRRPRTQGIVERSRMAGEVAQWSHPAAMRLRNTGLRLLPDRVFNAGLAQVLDWHPEGKA